MLTCFYTKSLVPKIMIRGAHSSSLKKITNRSPQKLIENTVKNMLPKVVSSRIPKRLKIYNTLKHPHLAQNPVIFEL